MRGIAEYCGGTRDNNPVPLSCIEGAPRVAASQRVTGCFVRRRLENQLRSKTLAEPRPTSQGVERGGIGEQLREPRPGSTNVKPSIAEETQDPSREIQPKNTSISTVYSSHLEGRLRNEKETIFFYWNCLQVNTYIYIPFG